MRYLIGAAVIATIIATSQPVAHAGQPKLNDVVVVPVRKLPPASQRPSESMFLHTFECDSTYLYIEQNQGQELVILDISDPGRIRLKADLTIDAHGPFDFRQRIGEKVVLLRYRDDSGFAILDLGKPKKPRLKSVDAPSSETFVEPVSVLQGEHGSHPTSTDIEDYNIVDKKHGQVVSTVKGVRQVLTDYVSGATYLLGQDGLTVVRHPRIESAIFPCPYYEDGPNG